MPLNTAVVKLQMTYSEYLLIISELQMETRSQKETDVNKSMILTVLYSHKILA